MAPISQGISSGALPLPGRLITGNRRYSLTYRRLSQAYKSAKVVPFDDTSRFVFFSDCHRGDNSRADSFARNNELFLHALNHYYLEGFTYVEVGDGDELWKNRKFSEVRRAHKCVFDLLHKFDRHDRLQLIVGNHDIQGFRRRRVEKDGITAEEALILRHTRIGQQIFVVHGHQADLESDQLYIIGRLLVRYVWKRLQLLGFVETVSQVVPPSEQGSSNGSSSGWKTSNSSPSVVTRITQPAPDWAARPISTPAVVYILVTSPAWNSKTAALRWASGCPVLPRGRRFALNAGFWRRLPGYTR